MSGILPYVGCALQFAANPREFLQRMRREHGDTFVLELFGAKLLFVFSATGVRALYQLPEHDASFTEATRGFLGLKIPAEVRNACNCVRQSCRVCRLLRMATCASSTLE